jgi:hypothetical protein
MGKKVTAQALGGQARTLDDAQTVRAVKEAMGLPNYTASVNGNPASDSDTVPDYAFVSLSAPVKGGC